MDTVEAIRLAENGNRRKRVPVQIEGTKPG